MLLPNLQSTPLVRRLLRRRFFTVAITVLVLVSAVALWTYAKVGRVDSSPSRAVAESPTVNPQQHQNKRPATPAPSSITVDTLTLTHLGFEPREITRPAGKFVLGIDNRLLNEEFSFELVLENGHGVRQLKMPKGQIRSRKLLNLPAGRYVLRVAEHPEWTCTIVLSD